MKFKALAAACLAVSLSSFALASAESDLCTEVEWWIVEGLNRPPFVSLDPAFKSALNGTYLPGKSLETLKGKPCSLSRQQPSTLWDDFTRTKMTCALPIEGEARGGRRDAKAAYRALRERLVKCPVLQGWKVTEKDEFSDSSINWKYQGAQRIELELRTELQDTTRSYSLALSLLRVVHYEEPAVGSGDMSFPERTAIPRDMAQWGGRVASAYPDIAQRLGWEGTVGLTVKVDQTGRAIGCSVTSSSGWPVLDHTACKNMERYARFDPVVDDQGNPAEGKFSTRIAYRLD